MKRNGIMRALLIALLSCGIVCALASCGVSYTVSYSLGEHAAEDATAPESVSYAEGEQITLPAAPEAEEGWEFTAWSDGSETYDAGESYTVEGDVTFTATWNEVSAPAVTYTVTYALGEHATQGAEVPAAQTVNEGATITLPAAPEAEEGWEFAAWSDGTETYDAGDSYTVEGNVTFTATWNEVSAPAVTYTVTYALGEHAAQGAEVPAAQTVNEGESVTLPAAPAAAAGYAFSGWYVGSDPLTGETYTPAASVTVTAQFAPITYTVEFSANGGSGDGMASMTFTYDAPQALTANTFTRTGYTFAGWTTNSEGTQAEYTDGQSVSNLTTQANATVTLYAVWTTNAYTVKFNANGGQGTMADQTFAYGTSQTLTRNAFTYAGHIFEGWATSQDGDVEYEDEESVLNLTAEANGSVTLYAVWMANQITVNFHYNYTTEAQTISVTIAYNSEMGDDADWATSTQTIASSRNGYECTAWNTQADGEGTAYTADTVLRSTETVDLYAQWSVIGYDITYELDGGTNADGNPATYTVESEAITLAAPTRMGYNFEGWTYDGQEEPEETVTIEKGSTGDRTYTAVWTAKTFTVTLDFNDDTTENKTITVTFDSTFGAAADNGWVAAPARAGYEFAGWYDNAQFEGDVYTAETKVSAELVEGFTLYANWTAHRWDVSVDGEVTQVENNGTYQLTVPEAQADKTFMGWADEEGEIVYTEAEELTVTEDITLTTVWATHNAIANEAELLAVLADQSVSAIRLDDNIEMTASGIDIRRNFSIDLNEKTIAFTTSASAAAAQRIRLTAYGTSYEQRISVSITNGALDFNTNANPNIDGSASMIFTQNVDLTMSDVTVTSDAMGLFIACGKLTMTDCVVTAAGGYAIGTNASVREASELYGPVEMTIEGSTLTANQADGAGLLFNVEGELTLTDTAITGGRQGVVIRSGTATITGGSITSAWSDPDKDSYLTTWGSGTAVPMAALVIGDISAGAYANNTIVTISGTQVNVTGDPEGARYIYIAGDTVDETMAQLTYGCDDEYMAALEGKENGIILGNEGTYTSVTVLHNESGMIHKERQEPTCTEDGHEEYYQCPDCKTYFTANFVETTWEALVIKATGSHSYGDPVYDAESDTISVSCVHGDDTVSATVMISANGAGGTMIPVAADFVFNGGTEGAETFIWTLPACDYLAVTGQVFNGWSLRVSGDEVGVYQPAATCTVAAGTAVELVALWVNVSAEKPIVIGTPDNTLAYTGNFPIWTGTISQGEIVTLSGTMTSDVLENFHTVLMYMWSENVVGQFRFDWWVSDAPNAGDGAAYAAEENWTIAKTVGPTWETFLATIANSNVALTYDWTKAGRILVTFNAVGINNSVSQTMTYTILPVGTTFAVDTYYIGLGGEASYTVINAVSVSNGTTPVYSENQTNPVVGSADHTLGFTNLTPAWTGNPVTKGGKVVVTGTLSSAGDNGWEVPIAYLFSTATNDVAMRCDGYLMGTPSAEGWSITVTAGITGADTNYTAGNSAADTAFLTAIKTGVTFTLTYDWTDESCIVVTAEFSDGAGMTRTTTYTITPTGTAFAHDSYNIGLGGEHIYYQVSSIARS